MEEKILNQDSHEKPSTGGFSGYIDLIHCLYNFFVHQKYSRENKNSNSDDLSLLQSIAKDFTYSKRNISYGDMLSVTSIILLLFILKKVLCDLTKYIITNRMRYCKKDSERLKESLWKLSFYLFSSSVLFYICVIKEETQYFLYPERVWQRYSADSSSIDYLENAVYLFQIAFYTYSMYATLFEDEWRKDSPVLLIHHIICTILLVLSSATRTHRTGILVLFLHDPCDVALEITKILMVIKVKDGKVIKSLDRATSVSFVIFTAMWITNRLYYYPITLMYFTLKYNMEHDLYVPFYALNNSLLTIILSMNFYWFTFIMKLAIKMILSDDPEGLVDIREYDKEDTNISTIEDHLLTDSDNKSSSNFKNSLISDSKLDALKEEEEEEEENKMLSDMNNNYDENNNEMKSVSPSSNNGTYVDSKLHFDELDQYDSLKDLNGNIISSTDRDLIDDIGLIEKTQLTTKMYNLRERRKAYYSAQQ